MALFSVSHMSVLGRVHQRYARIGLSRLRPHRVSGAAVANTNLGDFGPRGHISQSASAHSSLDIKVDAGRLSKENKSYKIARPFEDIPGPKPWPIVGNKLLFTSLGGYSMDRFFETSEKLYAQYGPMVRISGIMPGRGWLMLFRPEDVKRIYQIEGTYPERPPLDILACYRENRPKYFSSVGIVPSNGIEWKRLRVGVHSMMRPDLMKSYKERQAKVAQDLVHFLKFQPDCNKNGTIVVKDMLSLLMQYTLEGVGVVTTGTRLGCLVAEGVLVEAQSIIEANAKTLETLGKCFFLPPFHRLIATKHYRDLAASQDIIVQVVEKELKQRYYEREEDPIRFALMEPLLDSLMAREDLSKKDVLLLVTEVFQGGIDATATTLGFCLYFISRQPNIQQKLWEELENVDLLNHNLQGLPYLKAIVKETYRLRASASNAVSRFTPTDTVISGFHVPKGTFVQGINRISSKDPTVFPYPEECIPERWMKKTKQTKCKNSTESNQVKSSGNSGDNTQHKSFECMEEIASISSASDPYSLLPFSHGARMCPGRRLAEQEIYQAIIALVQAFSLEWVGAPEVNQVQKLNMMPDNTFDIKFKQR